MIRTSASFALHHEAKASSSGFDAPDPLFSLNKLLLPYSQF